MAQVLEKARPDLVVTTQAKAARPGKVLHRLEPEQPPQDDDLRLLAAGPPAPTVSTPVTWDEVEAAADGAPLSFEAADVLARVEELGDLFAPTVTEVQHLPAGA